MSGFGLQELGVETAPHGTVKSAHFLRTNFPNIFVCGDVAGPYQFYPHRLTPGVLRLGQCPADAIPGVPCLLLSDPLGHLHRLEGGTGRLNRPDAGEQNIPDEVITHHTDELRRAITDGKAHDFVKVLTVFGGEGIIVAKHTGELITELVTTMKFGQGLKKIPASIHIYPTLSEANKYVAGQ